jgi:2-C-methyl-D-erythritol 4-phosphate cytidylyltransferase
MFQGEAVTALIVAAGQSRRMGGQDKVFAPLANRPVLAHSVETFLAMAVVDEVVVVLHLDRLPAGQGLAQQRDWPARVRLCAGGARRQDSVRAGLEQIAGEGWVLIHDGARPLFSPALGERGLETALGTGAAVPGIQPVDTIKRISERGLVRETLPRDQLRAIQTPQVFRLAYIRNAHVKFADSTEAFTDDAAMLETLGWPIALFPGEAHNFKITTPEDLQRAELILGGAGQLGLFRD